MKNFTKTALLTCACLLAFTSCKKSEDAPASTSSNNTLSTNKIFITTGNWTLKSLTIYPGIDDGSGILITNMMPYMEECFLDNYYHFNTDNSGFYDEGLNLCSGEDQKSPIKYWSLSSDEKKMLIDGGEFDYAKIDAYTMQWKMDMGDPGDIQTWTFRYKNN
jgi:hypothetical protein